MKKTLFIVGPFFAMVLFWVIHSAVRLPQPYPAAAAFAYCVFYLTIAISAGRSTKLDIALTGFYLCGVVLWFASHHIGLVFLVEKHTAFLFMFLFLAAILPILFKGEPFTMGFAKRSTPEVFWETFEFKDINRKMTLVWAALFLVSGLSGLLPGTFFKMAVPLALNLGIGVPFNKKFPDWYLARKGSGPASRNESHPKREDDVA